MKFIKQILTVNLCFTMIVLTVSVSMAFFVIVPLSKKYLLPRFQNEHFRSEQTQKKASKLKANKENKNENRKTNKHSSNSNRIKEAIANHLELYNSKIMKPKNKIKFRNFFWFCFIYRKDVFVRCKPGRGIRTKIVVCLE